jgi:hypothetical protein
MIVQLESVYLPTERRVEPQRESPRNSGSMRDTLSDDCPMGSMYLPKEGLSLKENLPGPRIKSEALLSPLPLNPDFSSSF